MNELAETLGDVSAFVHRFVVVGGIELDALALWVAHSYVYDAAYATPYLHPHSPEPGSGKTTLLDVLALLARNAVQADNLTEAVLFRLIDSRRPTLLFDEVDAVFGKKNSDSTEGIRQVLNSGYRKGKKAWRCVPPSHDVVAFDVYCPKATAGLNELPGTLAHRSIPIEMKPPRPDDVYEDLDPEAVEAEAEIVRMNLQAWADAAEEQLRDPRLRPAKLADLDARGNEIWRILLRIADLAGNDWPERARTAAVVLSGKDRRQQDTSTGVKLLGHIRELLHGERVTCQALVDALNGDDQMPYGGWSDGKGISTRALGKKLAPYEIWAKPIRIDGERAGNGYEIGQFEDAWTRYLPGNPDPERYSGTTRAVEPEPAETKAVQASSVPLSEDGAKRHEQPDVPLVPLSRAEQGNEDASRPLIGELMYPLWMAEQGNAGHVTEQEFDQLLRLHEHVAALTGPTEAAA